MNSEGKDHPFWEGHCLSRQREESVLFWEEYPIDDWAFCCSGRSLWEGLEISNKAIHYTALFSWLKVPWGS